MKKNTAFQLTSLLGLTLVIVLLGCAFFLEMNKGIHPCPLCLLQRIVMISLGTLFFVGTVFKFKRKGCLFLNGIMLLANACGILLSGRQVWLQMSPSSEPGECSASLSYLFQVFPIQEIVRQVWQGGMECSQAGWEFFHLSLAAWSLIGFSLLLLLIILQLVRVALD